MRPTHDAGAEQVSMFLSGLAVRSQIIDLPLGVFSVNVTKCSGAGECAAVCMVKVFTTDSAGRCTVVNDELCFGCMACVAQCLDKGVTVEPREARRYPTAEDLLR